MAKIHDALSLLNSYFVAATCRSDLSQTCTHAATMDVYTRCDNAAIAHFVAATYGTNSNQFEFVPHVAATKFCCSDIVCRMSHGATVTATCCSDVLPSVSRP